MDVTSIVVQVVGLVVVALASWFGLRQLRLNERQRLLNFGQFYVERYWQIDDDLLMADKNEDVHRQHRHRYLRLCEDEFDAAREGWLDLDQWDVWHREIASGPTQEILKSDLEAVGQGPLVFVHIRACLAGTPTHSWPDCRAFASPPKKSIVRLWR